MQQKLLDYFSKFEPLTQQEKVAITRNLVIKEFPKGTFLLRAGDRSMVNYFVLSGCVRQFYLREGNENTTQFYIEENWLLPAIDSQGVSEYSLQCVEDCHLVVASEKEGNELINEFPKFQELSQKILEKELIMQQKHLSEYMSSTPEKRYLKMQTDNPELINRIPQFQLASYLGIKPESLSRIRKRIAKKRNL